MAGPNNDRLPTYLSSRSADVILSEIRPTKLNAEAWRSINVLLDELLWMILSAARSFSTEQIKVGLLKVLPTPLGKEALLEAEVELRAYWDRTASATPTRAYVENAQEFPLQPAYELMRLKCEAYSTLNDTDEDMDAEDRWQAKVTNASGFSTSNTPYISPAALYLTAIIEAICEHVLSNIGRVTARDSSRTTASLQDLYIALCEDDAIYGLFKNMKVHEQIELQSKALSGRPRRSKSINRPSEHGRTSSHTLTSSYSTGTGSDHAPPAPPSKSRGSSESTGSNQFGANGSRSSLEKAKAKRLFGRGSAEKENAQNGNGYGDGGHKRTDSQLSNGKRSVTPYEESAGHSPSATEVEFDELMRSGTTMKVSLTPDRLKSFEVYNKEKVQRGNKSSHPSLSASGSKSSPHDSSADISASSEATTEPSRSGHSTLVRSDIQHESIWEDEEGNTTSSGQSRQRKKSRGYPPVSYEAPPPPPPIPVQPSQSQSSRMRSMSASQTAQQNRQTVGRKASLGVIARVESLPVSSDDKVPRNHVKQLSSSMSTPGGRNGLGRRDSLDGSPDGTSEDDLPLQKTRSTLKHKPKAATGIGSDTRDLISFLNDGPPEPPAPPAFPPETVRKQGRFRSMVSKLKRGSSTEKLYLDDSSRKSSFASTAPSFVPPPLSAKKSLISLSTYATQQYQQSQSQKTPISPPSSPSQTTHDEKEKELAPLSSALPSSRSPVSPVVRKAAPAWPTSQTGSAAGRPVDSAASSPARQPEPSITTTVTVINGDAQKPKVEHVRTNGDVLAAPTPSSKASVTLPSVIEPPSPILPRPTHSKQVARRALTPPASPASLTFASNVKDLRRLMANASNADECRLLVDMFLAQSGFPLSALEFVPDPPKEPTEQEQSSVVETLLSNGDALAKEKEPLATTTPAINPPTPRSNSNSPTTAGFTRRQVPPVELRTPMVAQVVSANA